MCPLLTGPSSIFWSHMTALLIFVDIWYTPSLLLSRLSNSQPFLIQMLWEYLSTLVTLFWANFMM